MLVTTTTTFVCKPRTLSKAERKAIVKAIRELEERHNYPAAYLAYLACAVDTDDPDCA
ncbi:hypothetical protein OG563_06005 [Nocardia vinacea]|uniref:Uncharacterized protein n=1 Tax=Nocardia vinacea TaxID=96468 RepID=A0ABZ1YX40_9NOCA|nr:hypothetical protein [Nocardia vinacea]